MLRIVREAVAPADCLHVFRGSWLKPNLLDKGLRSTEDPGFGGWGGRFRRVRDNEFNPEADYWATAPDACEPPMRGEAYQLTRWIGDWMNDFASRASDGGNGRDTYMVSYARPIITVTTGED